MDWCCEKYYFLNKCPELRRNYLLNLSISVSRGKETNEDFRSNGEWTGIWVQRLIGESAAKRLVKV